MPKKKKADEEEDREPHECNGECGATVTHHDPYYATPCGTFCSACMTKHVKQPDGCGICHHEFPELSDD